MPKTPDRNPVSHQFIRELWQTSADIHWVAGGRRLFVCVDRGEESGQSNKDLQQGA